MSPFVLSNHPENLVNEFIKLLMKIVKDLPPKATEEDLRIRFCEVLNKVLEKRGIYDKITIQYEVPVQLRSPTANIRYRGRIDALYNNVVLEFKKPGSLRNEATLYDAVAQLVEYLVACSTENGKLDEKKLEKLSGYIIDGYSLIRVYYRKKKGAETIGEAVKPLDELIRGLRELRRIGKVSELQRLIDGQLKWYFDIHPITLFEIEEGEVKPTLQARLALKQLLLTIEAVAKLPLTPELFEQRFGVQGLAKKAVPLLLRKLDQSLEQKTPGVQDLYLSWKNIYLGLAGYNIDQLLRKQRHIELLEQWGIKVDPYKALKEVEKAIEELPNEIKRINEIEELKEVVRRLKRVGFQRELLTKIDELLIKFREIHKYKNLTMRLKNLLKIYELPSMLLYALHTYYSIVLKLLAYELASLHQDAAIEPISPLQRLAFRCAEANLEDLKRDIEYIEEGIGFKVYGFKNLVEKDVYSWYLKAWDHEIKALIKDIVNGLLQFNIATSTLRPEYVRDLLKKLYQNLVPRGIRHDLGEYYTPDWLAELVIEEVNSVAKEYGKKPIGDPNVRVIDPACGSGTFLVLTIQRIVQNFYEQVREQPEKEVELGAEYLKKVLHNVVGLDINPLAVLTARINYILALAPLLQYRSIAGLYEIEIPVYMTDSIIAPTMEELAQGLTKSKQKTLLDFITVERRPRALIFELRLLIPYEEIVFEIPISLFQKVKDDTSKKVIAEKIFGIMEKYTAQTATPPASTYVKELKQELNRLNIEVTEEEEKALEETYIKILNLREQGRDHIWCTILKNWIAPIWLGAFDYAIGNPPWVNWENLPQSYRNLTKNLWVYYGLFSLEGFETLHGGGKKDISMLMSYVITDKMLKPRGILGFLITQTVFKTRKAGEGFRRLSLGGRNYMKLIRIHDMVDIRPFEGAQNRAAAFVWIKGEKTKYPVPYIKWAKKARGDIDPDLTLDEVLSITSQKFLEALPLKEKEGEPLITLPRGTYEKLKRIIGPSPYRAYEGCNTGGANAVYWVQILEDRGGTVVITNYVKGAKRRVPRVTAVIEKGLLFPLIRGRDVNRWRVKPREKLYVIMVQDPVKRIGYDVNWMKKCYPLTFNYLDQFRQVLLSRSAYRRYFVRAGKATAPFYTMYGVGPYTFAPYKVVWREVATDMIAAVVEPFNDRYLGNRTVIPDHTCVFIPFNTREEAYYVCAILNSTLARLIIRQYIHLHPSPHVMDYVDIPKYDPNNKLHQKLVELSLKAHSLAREGKYNELKKVEEQIDIYVGKLYSFSENEIYELKNIFSELLEEEEITKY